MFLPAQTSCAVDVLGGLGLNIISACCKRDCEGHIKLTAKAAELPENSVLRKAADTLSQELGAALALPAIRDTEGGVELTFGEKPRFCFEIGSDQRPASDDGDCGDCCDCVGLEDGRNVIILSDGMGTGRRAAVDSAMATDLFASLICSGLSCEAALRTVNTALIAKSEDESLATLDIASLDPYSGEISFFKAGAAPCFIKRAGRTAILELPSLPAGILSRIGFSTAGAARGRHGGYDIGRRGCGRQRVDIEAPSLLAGGRSGARRGVDRRRTEPPQRKKIRRYDRDMRADSRRRPNRELTKPAA